MIIYYHTLIPTTVSVIVVKSDIAFVLSVIAIGMAIFAVMFSFIGLGSVRSTQIYLPEQIRQTVAFEENGNVKLIGVAGTGELDNPTLITRAGDYAYVLTVINLGKSPHMLYIDGLDVQTKLLQPEDQDTILVVPKKPATYHYYDKADGLHMLGELKVVKVVPMDTFGQ